MKKPTLTPSLNLAAIAIAIAGPRCAVQETKGVAA